MRRIETVPLATAVDVRASAILLLAGMCLMLVQYGAMRELAALLGSNELIIVAISTGYFLGVSLGYLVGDRISPRLLFWAGVATMLLHASLPFSVRWGLGELIARGFASWVPGMVMGLAVFGLTPFYAVFLPRLLQLRWGDTGAPTLAKCYALELTGGAVGLLALVLITPERMQYIFTLHLTGLVTLLALVSAGRKSRWQVLWLGVPVVYLFAWPLLHEPSLAHFYRRAKNLPGAEIVASSFSPYQRVDLVRFARKPPEDLRIYLNGNLLYGTASLHRHNLMVSLLPNFARATVAGPPRSLVVAGGSLDAVRFLAPRVADLNVVEIDAVVTDLTRRYIQEPRGGFPENWRLIIDDGKHFLGTWTGLPFDVISVDVPVPSHLQTAMLHSPVFFELARQRLAPSGVFSISLAGRLAPRLSTGSEAPGTIVASDCGGVDDSFPSRRGGADGLK